MKNLEELTPEDIGKLIEIANEALGWLAQSDYDTEEYEASLRLRAELDEALGRGDALIESPSGWKYRQSQENGDSVDCQDCGKPLSDDLPIVNDDEGFAYHPECHP